MWQQLASAHRFRNDLVALRHRYEQQLSDVWSGHPQIADIERQLAAASQEADALEAQARREHAADRTTVTRAETATELRTARGRVGALRRQRRAAIAEVYPATTPVREALLVEHKAAVKSCRQRYAADGLYWATYNLILARHVQAVRRVQQEHEQGRQAMLRVREWNCAGTIAVTLQRRSSEPPRTPELLASGTGRWRNVLQITPWLPPSVFLALPRHERRRTARSGVARFAIGAGRHLTLPITVDRMLPATADVVTAELVVEQLAGRPRAALRVTARVPDPEPVRGRHPVAVHFGWRLRSGSVRVGTWASSEPMAVPPHLSEVVRSYDAGRWGEIVLPPAWVEVAGRPDALRSRRDTSLAAVQRRLAEWLDQRPQPDNSALAAPITAMEVRKWRSPRRFAELVRQLDQAPLVGDGAAEVIDMLRAWHRPDRQLWQWEANEADQIRSRRDNAWHQVAAWLADQVDLLLVDDTDLSSLLSGADLGQIPRQGARPGPVDGEAVGRPSAVPAEVTRRARARANLAAPGRLRRLLTSAAQHNGATVREVPNAHLTRTHRRCGHVADPHRRYERAAEVACPGCGQVYDQDYNAALLMLDQSGELHR
ncbi:zinc ribbon domain-containing protein [Plantactinospora sp. WMMB334]|uniref:zinc ribbon domain-containing protein n=1 Tax=Plantactinospora sp. WMMB334 TaxID=3404119 RepID=UPI003B9613E4